VHTHSKGAPIAEGGCLGSSRGESVLQGAEGLLEGGGG